MPRPRREIYRLCDSNKRHEHGRDTGDEADEEGRRIDQGSLGEKKEDDGNDVDWRDRHHQSKGEYLPHNDLHHELPSDPWGRS